MVPTVKYTQDQLDAWYEAGRRQAKQDLFMLLSWIALILGAVLLAVC